MDNINPRDMRPELVKRERRELDFTLNLDPAAEARWRAEEPVSSIELSPEEAFGDYADVWSDPLPAEPEWPDSWNPRWIMTGPNPFPDGRIPITPARPAWTHAKVILALHLVAVGAAMAALIMAVLILAGR